MVDATAKKVKETMIKIELDDDEIAFLHIGKNAGTQVKNIAENLSKYGMRFRILGHFARAVQLPENARYFFSVRKPETRFVSGFYSRKRKGQPLMFNEWTKHEAIAFGLFDDANELAENLFCDGDRGKQARMAVKSITHTGMQQYDWFLGCGFLGQQPPITIVRQEKFISDIQRLLAFLNVDVDVNTLVVTNNTSAHKNDYTNVPPLSDLALENLRKWYIQDYYFYNLCEEWLGKGRL